MPFSHPENKIWAINKILSAAPTTILDVGPGVGTYARHLKEAGYANAIEGIEIWQPYIEKYSLGEVYDRIHIGDVRGHQNFKYDVVIFGDVLEHMSAENAVDVWNKVSRQATYALISIPIILYTQGPLEGNPYEEHTKPDWCHEEVIRSFSHIVDWKTFEMTGSYWAVFR